MYSKLKDSGSEKESRTKISNGYYKLHQDIMSKRIDNLKSVNDNYLDHFNKLKDTIDSYRQN
jgi:hypothetical protein